MAAPSRRGAGTCPARLGERARRQHAAAHGPDEPGACPRHTLEEAPTVRPIQVRPHGGIVVWPAVHCVGHGLLLGRYCTTICAVMCGCSAQK